VQLRKWLQGFAITLLVLSGLIVLVSIIFLIIKRKIAYKNPVKTMYIFTFLILLVILAGAIVFWIENGGS